MANMLQRYSYQEALNKIAGQRQMLLQDAATADAVRDIIKQVADRGDEALYELTKRFDRADLSSLSASEQEFATAEASLPEAFKSALKTAHARVRAFHHNQQPRSWFVPTMQSSLLGQSIQPLAAAGLYSPGGKAVYPSSLLMNAVPAEIAGVKRLVVCTPPQADGTIPPALLYTARLCGVEEVYKLGGAQAIAALALGTGSIAPVDKVTGPGNKFVAEAKRQLFGLVDIDMIAGPSEILILADENTDPEIIVSDLFSQAEHDEDARAVLVTYSQEKADAVDRILPDLLEQEPRKEIIAASLKNNGMNIVVEDLAEAFTVINAFAPEHLEILAELDFAEITSRVKNAGAIFIGPHTPEALGDYTAGPNHTLPTAGTARFSSPLGVYDFYKRSSVLSFSQADMAALGQATMTLANHEELVAHARSVEKRLDSHNTKE